MFNKPNTGGAAIPPMMIEKATLQLKARGGWGGGAAAPPMMIEKLGAKNLKSSLPHDDRKSDDSIRGKKSKK